MSKVETASSKSMPSCRDRLSVWQKAKGMWSRKKTDPSAALEKRRKEW